MKYLAFNIGEEYQLGNRGINQVFPTMGSLFSTILFNLYGLAGIILLFLLIFGGWNIMIGAGSQDSGKIQKGQKAVQAAVIGFIIIFTSYFIIQLIEAITGVNILNPGI